MVREFNGISRLETACAYVKDGKIVRVFHSHDEPGGETFDVRRGSKSFEFRLRNVLDIISLHNKTGFEELLGIIRESDPLSYQLALDVIETNKKVDEFMNDPKNEKLLDQIFGWHDYELD